MCLVTSRLLFGCQLDTAAKAIKKSINFCNDYSSIISHQILIPIENVCCVLMGLKTGALDAKQASRLCHDIEIEVILLYALHMFTYLAMYMIKLAFGKKLMAEIRKRKATARTLTPFCTIYHVFCEGILAAALGRTDKAKIRVARRRLKKLEKLAFQNPETFSNKVCLLKAELKACAGKREEALALFDSAIYLSDKHGFVHEQALAREKAAMMLLDCQRRSEAEAYLSKSRSLYSQWGAQAKVNQLDKILGCRQLPSCTETQGSSRQ